MILAIDPVSKPRMTQSDKWKKRPATTKYWQFKSDLNDMVTGTLEPQLELIFNVPMPKSWSNKKKFEMDGKPHQQKPDIDNFIKSFLDALCEDDSYVYDIHASKYWAKTGSIEIKEGGNGN